MIARALWFGLWAVAWFVAYSVLVTNLIEFARLWMPICVKLIPVVFATAFGSWLFVHRGGRELSTGGFGLLVLGVCLPSHFVFVALQVGFESFGVFIALSLFELLFHFGITLPLATIATWLFIRLTEKDDATA